MLAASHVWERELYEKIRALYNSIHPVECKLAPPFEEWTGMPGLCDHIFCRCSECECLLTGDSLVLCSMPPAERDMHGSWKRWSGSPD